MTVVFSGGAWLADTPIPKPLILKVEIPSRFQSQYLNRNGIRKTLDFRIRREHGGFWKEAPMQKRVAIYLRVSTSKQDTENQLRELSAVADRSGWEIWKVYEDAGISGAQGPGQTPWA